MGILRNIKNSMFWSGELNIDMCPNWLQRAIESYEWKYNPVCCIKYFKGKSFIYKIVYTPIEQGHIDRRIFRKLRTH